VHSSVSFLSRRYDIGDPAGHDHRIVAVHQVPDERTSGKNLMLRTLIDMILSAVISGTWNRVPSLMLECDDDSILFVEDDHLANPIEELIREMRERHLAALGAHWRSARYSMKLAGEELYEYPDTSIPLDPMYQWMDFSQQEWARCLVGGGTLGETSLLTAVRWPVCHRYPGSLSDDLHRTIYVDQLREPWDVSRRVAVFNDAKGYQQTLRWIRSKLALIEAFGRRPILNLYRSNGIPQKLLDMDLGSLTLLAARLQGEPTASLQGRADW
jgi:hypothetical protein